MPFSPLPATFIDDLAGAAGRPVLELGCGAGAFTRVLRERGVRVVALDRRHGAAGVIGDALAPPLRPASFPVVVAANLLRHLWRRTLRASGPGAWRDLVAPGGSLWILEDEPSRWPRPARHYRDLQALLAGVPDLGRGPLLPRDSFARARARWGWPGAWRDGAAANAWPADANAVLALLGGATAAAGGEAARLRAAIARDGLGYGTYWWARWEANGG